MGVEVFQLFAAVSVRYYHVCMIRPSAENQWPGAALEFAFAVLHSLLFHHYRPGGILVAGKTAEDISRGLERKASHLSDMR